MENKNNNKSIILFHLVTNLVVVIFITGASYYHTPLNGIKDTAVYGLHLIALQTSVAGFIYLLTLSRWVFRLVFGPLFFILCCYSFWGYSQDISITPHLIQALFETKPDIAIDLISFPYLIFIGISIIILLVLIKWQSSINPRLNWPVYLTASLCCISVFWILEQKRPGSLKNRLPYNIYYAVKSYTKKPNLKLNKQIPEVTHHSDALKMILVLGESVRADHLSINGYNRPTTPKLEQQNGLISFPNVYTEHTYTAVSLPQILTNQGQVQNDSEYFSIYDILNKANYKTYWVGNQALEKSYTPIVKTNDSIHLIDAFKSVFSFDKLRDESLIPVAANILEQNPRSVISLHMIGSHWWYEDRYSPKEKVFSPVIDSKYIPSLTPEQLINSYDNTLVYLDKFMNKLIGVLEDEETPTVLVYISDHGEQLGEDGKWLHAQSGKATKNPAYMMWFSESYTKKYPKVVNELKETTKINSTTDRVFYDVLSLLGINFANKL